MSSCGEDRERIQTLVAHGDWVKDRLTIAPIWREDMLKYVSMDVTNSMCLVDQIMQIFFAPNRGNCV